MIINSANVRESGIVTLAFMKHIDEMAEYIIDMYCDNRKRTLETFGLENVLEAHRHYLNKHYQSCLEK